MDDRDKRAKELSHLKLALATFAIQLDAFEARLKGRKTSVKALVKPSVKASPPMAPEMESAKKSYLR